MLDQPLHGIGALRKGCQIPGTVVPAYDRRSVEGGGGAPVCHPGVPENLLGRVALAGLLHQQVADEVFGLPRDGAPVALGELVATLLDRAEQLVLTGLTELALFPAAVAPTTAIEWRVAAEQDVDDNS